MYLATSEEVNFISIPYGAIKSAKSEGIELGDYAFQFLMVRLKADG